MSTVFLQHFNTEMEAGLAQNILKEQGIVAIIQTRGLNKYTGWSDFNGVDLIVAEKDLKKAKEILEL